MTIDDDDLTPEEIKTLKAITAARIKALELKALKRLSMTDEEKAAFKQNPAIIQNTGHLCSVLPRLRQSN
jgi:hypothetical protein